MNVLHPSLSKSFALNICSKDPMKNSTLGYFCKITYSQMHCKFQPWCLFGIWLLCSVLWFDFFYPHITSHVLFAKSFKHLRRTGLCKLEKYTFLWFKKRVFYFWWEIQVSSSKKYVKFLSCGYHFPSYISRLNLINLNSLFKIVTREVVSSW